jgi:hypothetical protein
MTWPRVLHGRLAGKTLTVALDFTASSSSAGVNMFATFVQRRVNQVASSSKITLAAFSTSSSSLDVPRARNWRIPKSYPSPSPIARSTDDIDDSPLTPIAEELPTLPRRPKHVGPTPPEHAEHVKTLLKRFPKSADGVSWAPPRKLSRDAMDGMRTLHNYDPTTFSTPMLAERFRISPEAVRRILKSRWEPSRDQRVRMAERDKVVRQAWIKEQRDIEKAHRGALTDKTHDKLTML